MLKSVLNLTFFRDSFGFSSLILLFACVSAGSVRAETIVEDDYVYIGVEAEDFISKDDRWVLTDASTGEQEDDPDGNHSDGASGGVYFELLPDIRVTHDDVFGPPTAYWGQAGTGPEMEWDINIPEPGRYHVHIRAYSTGTEDNGIHVGIDGGWPESGRRLQFCTAGQGWSWSSKQRDSGGNGSCGAQKTIYFDIATVGSHTLAVSAREDGFEIDRLALIKDLSGNTKICSPTNATGVDCVNGSIESTDGFINLKLAMEPGETAVTVNQLVPLTLSLENLDGYDTATNVAVTLPLAGQWEVETNDADCQLLTGNLVCELASLKPTAPDEKETFEIVLKPLVSGSLELAATATADEVDDTPTNDSAAITFTVDGEIPPTDVSNTDGSSTGGSSSSDGGSSSDDGGSGRASFWLLLTLSLFVFAVLARQQRRVRVTVRR